MSHHRRVPLVPPPRSSPQRRLPNPLCSKPKRLRSKRERDAAKFGPKRHLRGARQGPRAPPCRLPPSWGDLPLGSPLGRPKAVVITQKRLCHRGLFNHEVRSLDVQRLLTPGPAGDGHPPPPPAPQIEEGEAEGVPAEALKELVGSLALLLGGFGAFSGRALVAERRRSLMAVLRRHRCGPLDLGVFLAHRTPAQPPGQGTPQTPPREVRPGPPGRAVDLGGWEVGNPPAGTPSPLRAVNRHLPPPQPPAPIFRAPGERETPFLWSSAEDEDEDTAGGLPHNWGGPGGLLPGPPPFWGSPQPPKEEEEGDEGWTPIAPPTFGPDPPAWGHPPRDPRGLPRASRPPRTPQVWRLETPWDPPDPSRPPWDPPRAPLDLPRPPWEHHDPARVPPDLPRPPRDPRPQSPDPNRAAPDPPRPPRTPQLWNPEPARAPPDAPRLLWEPPRPLWEPPNAPRPLWDSPDAPRAPLAPPRPSRAPQFWRPEPPWDHPEPPRTLWDSPRARRDPPRPPWDPRPWSPDPPNAPPDPPRPSRGPPSPPRPRSPEPSRAPPDPPRPLRTPQLWNPEAPRDPPEPPRPLWDPPRLPWEPPDAPRSLWDSPDSPRAPPPPPKHPRAPQFWSPESLRDHPDPPRPLWDSPRAPRDPRPWSPEPPGTPPEPEASRCCCRRLCRGTAQRDPLHHEPFRRHTVHRDPPYHDTFCRAPPRPAPLCLDMPRRDPPHCCHQPPKRCRRDWGGARGEAWGSRGGPRDSPPLPLPPSGCGCPCWGVCWEGVL